MLIVEVRGDQVWRRFEGQGSGAALPVPELPGRNAAGVIAALADWATRYGRAAAVGAELDLRGIGEEIFAWLDQGGALEEWLAGPERALEIRVDPARPGPLAEALLAAPWEVLCRNGGFLAEEGRLFVVSRRCGGSDAPAPARHSDLSLMFMAAAPEGQSELDFEAEEAAILEATKAKDDRPPLAHVQVEESGALEFLAERLRLDGPFEALHLSCHGDIVAQGGRGAEPGAAARDGRGRRRCGRRRPADQRARQRHAAAGLRLGLPHRRARRGAQGHRRRAAGYRDGGSGRGARDSRLCGASTADGGTQTGAPPELAEPFVRQLAVHAPNVLGWDGSVYDRDATLFAEALYGELGARRDGAAGGGAGAPGAVRGRAEDPQRGRHWHLARVYLGPGGGGALCDPAGEPRPARPDPEEPFLDPKNKRVPVATRAEFVGRRRQIQAVLAAFRGGRKGVLVHGMGNLGKSSLAARVAARMPRHRTAVVFGRCHALAVFAALKGAVEDIADGMPYDKAQAPARRGGGARERGHGQRGGAGGSAAPAAQGTLDAHPVLLVLDDLEQSLETPSADRPEVQPAAGYRDALVAVFTAFEKAATASRLLLTSRYDFVLPDGAGNDLAAGLVRVPLAPMRAAGAAEAGARQGAAPKARKRRKRPRAR